MAAQENHAGKTCGEDYRSGSVKAPERVFDLVPAAGGRAIRFYEAGTRAIARRYPFIDGPDRLVLGCADRARILPRILWLTEKTVVRHLAARDGQRQRAAASLLLITPGSPPSALGNRH